jgi:hypothetical protein
MKKKLVQTGVSPLSEFSLRPSVAIVGSRSVPDPASENITDPDQPKILILLEETPNLILSLKLVTSRLGTGKSLPFFTV